MNHPYRHNPMLSTSSSSNLTTDGNSTGGDHNNPPPPNGEHHPIPTVAIPSNNNNDSGNSNALEESILDFSDMESISDFLSVHALRGIGGGGGGGGGDERDRGYSCSDDDLFTNSDQWSSITNITAVVNNNMNMNNNMNNMNHSGTSENNSLSNLRSILEPTPEESGRDDSTSITFSPLQQVPHTMINFGDFNHAPQPPPPPPPQQQQQLVSSISSPIPFHNNNNNNNITHLMNPQQQQQQFHHTLQQHQNTQDHSNNNTTNSQAHLHHQNNNNNNNNSGHFSFMDQASNFSQQNRAAAVVSNNNMNHYDLTSASNFHNSNSSLQSTFSGAGMSSDNNNNNDMNLNQSNHQLQQQLNTSSSSGMTMHRNTVADTSTSTSAITATSVYTASTVPVQDPNINDVLLGRGGKNNQWSGNETLRELARTMSTVYSAAPKRNKPSIAMLLVQKIRALSPSGRFLKQEQSVGAWFEVDEEVAREKASQCLRDIVAATTKMKSVTSMVDCNGNINMAMMGKGSKSTTSLRNASSFAGSKMRTSSSGHGTANATFTSFTAMNPAVVSSSSTATLADRLKHINSSSSSSSTINTGNLGGLRGSVASFFDNHRNKNESASNLLSGVKSASRTAAQSGLALLRATPSMTASSTGTKVGIGASSATPTVNNQRRISSNVGMDATNSGSSSTSGLGNFEWNAKNRSNIISGSHQQNNESSHQMSSMSSVSQLQQERPAAPTFNVTSGNSNTATGSQSVAARAGLALLQRGSGMGTSNAFSAQQSNPNTASTATSNANMSRVVSNMYSSNNSMRNMLEHQQPSQNLTTSGSFHKLENIGSTNSEMQISSNNLRDINGEQQIRNNAGNMNYSNIGTHIGTQQQLQSSSRKNSKRNLISASAPNLGDISSFLAKRRRPMLNAQWVNNDESNSSENAAYNVTVNNNDISDVGNLLEQDQLRDPQIPNGSNTASMGHTRPGPGRAASMITLGANTSSTGGNAIYNSSVVGQNNITNNDQLLQRFHELRSQILTTTASIENLAQKNDNVRRLSCVREQQESSMPNVNFHWNNNITGNGNSTIDQSLPGDSNGNPTTSRSSNMFASLLQQPRIGTAVTSLPMATSASSTGVSSNYQPLQQPQQLMNHHTSDMNNYLGSHTSTDSTLNDSKNFDCFTGLGEAMGDSDDTALQRWIDHMAEEELS